MKRFEFIKLLSFVWVLLLSFSSLYGEIIKKGDAIKVSLKGVPLAELEKINEDYRVRDSGNIRIPIINVNVLAAGRKPEQVERSIEEAFKAAQIYTSPTISLQIVLGGDGVVAQKVLSVGTSEKAWPCTIP